MKVGIRRCPVCYEEVTEDYALTSAMVIVMNTIACDLANSIRAFNFFAVIAVIISVFTYVAFPALIFFGLIYTIIPLFCVLLWFYRFGSFGVGDEDYLNSKRAMKRTLLLWLAVLASQLIALAVWRF